MVALPKYEPYPKFPIDIEYAGDLIMRRSKARREAARKEAHHQDRRTPYINLPLTEWLLRQEVLYRQQMAKERPARPVQPLAHVYHLRGELPCNRLGDLIFKAVSFIGSFFDAWSAAHA